LSKPNLEKLRKEDAKKESTKPKKFFKFGAAKRGGDNAFAQMMR